MSEPEDPNRSVEESSRIRAASAKNRIDGILFFQNALSFSDFSTAVNIYSIAMKGLYVHVPFCSKVCGYCDFSTVAATPRLFAEYADLVLREAELRLSSLDFQTVYFGGGTPSVLPFREWERLISGLKNLGVDFQKMSEVDLEGNPDSLSPEFLEAAHGLGVNRFSLGIQTFHDGLLERIGRRGSAAQARQALENLVGFSKKANVRATADLMFSLPGQTLEDFSSDVLELAQSGIGHVSFYGLILNPHTVLGRLYEKGSLEIDEDLYPKMYEAGVKILHEFGIERYEVSNFARKGEESVHNRNYWLRGEYLGLGPGAHSFDGDVRRANPFRYLNWKRWIENGCPESGQEIDRLGSKERIDEKIWLSLRLREGLDVEALECDEGFQLSQSKIDSWVEKGCLERRGSRIALNGHGWLWMDRIVENLMPD